MLRSLLLLAVAFSSQSAWAITEKQIYCQDVPNDPSPAVMFGFGARHCSDKSEIVQNLCTTTSMCIILDDDFLTRTAAAEGKGFYDLTFDQQSAAIRADKQLPHPVPAMITCMELTDGNPRCPMLNECKEKRDVLINPSPVFYGPARIDEAQKRFDSGNSRFVPITNPPVLPSRELPQILPVVPVEKGN